MIVRRASDSDSEGTVSPAVDYVNSLGLGFTGYASARGLGFECGCGSCIAVATVTVAGKILWCGAAQGMVAPRGYCSSTVSNYRVY